MTAWIITKDLLASEEDKQAHPNGKCNAYALNLTGPRTASDRDVERLMAGEGIEFRLLELYYEGRRLEESDADEGYYAENELAPLDNFGLPNAGCAIQEEKNKDGKWESIN